MGVSSDCLGVTYGLAILLAASVDSLLPGQAQSGHVVESLHLVVLGVYLGLRWRVVTNTAEIHKGGDLGSRFNSLSQGFGGVDAGVPHILLESWGPAPRRIQDVLTRGINHGVHGPGNPILLQLVPGDAFRTGHPGDDRHIVTLFGQMFGQIAADEAGAAA